MHELAVRAGMNEGKADHSLSGRSLRDDSDSPNLRGGGGMLDMYSTLVPEAG